MQQTDMKSNLKISKDLLVKLRAVSLDLNIVSNLLGNIKILCRGKHLVIVRTHSKLTKVFQSFLRILLQLCCSTFRSIFLRDKFSCKTQDREL